MTLELGTIVFTEHNLYINSFFLIKTGILEKIRFNIEYSKGTLISMSILQCLHVVEDFFEIIL